MEKIYILGTSGFASEVTEYILDNEDYAIKGYFDTDDKDYRKYKYKAPFLGSEENFNFDSDDNVIIAIADNKIREKIYNKLVLKNVALANVIHKDTFVSKTSKIDKGAIIAPFVTLTSNVKIGKNFQANIYSYIAHDCIIGNYVTFAPAVKCNGNVIIEDNVYIGTGTIIYQGKPNKPLVIGEGSIVSAGSVVTKSIPKNTTVFGNPAIEFTKENFKRRM